jgi:4-hydroxy-2-oxoheptanedioate aldolase
MDLPSNRFKHALAAGEPQIGLWLSLSDHYSAEVCAGAGFDWLLVDTEHSPNELDMVLAQLQAIAPYPTHAIVRVPWNDMVMIKRVLDIGAQSLLIPYVNTADEARNAVAYTRYPPQGVRGVAGTTRATRFGRIKDYAQRVQEELCVLVQLETQTALDQLEYPGETANPAVLPKIEDAIRRIRACGKAPGILTADERLVRRYLELGALFVAVGADVGLLARGSEQLAAKFKT